MGQKHGGSYPKNNLVSASLNVCSYSSHANAEPAGCRKAGRVTHSPQRPPSGAPNPPSDGEAQLSPDPPVATSPPRSGKILKENDEWFKLRDRCRASPHGEGRHRQGPRSPPPPDPPPAPGAAASPPPVSRSGAPRAAASRCRAPRIAGRRLLKPAPLLSRSPPRQGIRFRSFATKAVAQFSASLVASPLLSPQKIRLFKLLVSCLDFVR